MRQELRPYQQKGVEQILGAISRGCRKVLVVLPTGGGKTSIFTFLTEQVDVPTLIIVHRRELATQACKRLREFGVGYGLILAGEQPRPGARVQVAGIQSLARRGKPPARLVIPDEAHLSTAETWRKTLDLYPDALVLGFTATPWRLSGKPLAGAYDEVVVIATPRELRELGFLCDYAGFSYLAPDLSKVKTTAGEFNEKQSSAAMRQPHIVANIVEQWKAHASHLSTVAFCVTVEHSKELCAQFKAAGVAAEHLDGKTPTLQRDAILKRMESGATRVLCNVGVAVEGLDIPRLKCCIDAQPTRSLTRAIQKWGRVRRPWNGQRARIHDHAFNIKRHGLPDDDRDYKLDAKPEKPPALRTCEICLAIYVGVACPACEHVNETLPRGKTELVTIADAEQFEFSSETKPLHVALPPVPVRWEKPGRAIEGKYTGTSTRKESWGFRKLHVLEGAKRVYHLPGTAHLDKLMARVPKGAFTCVTYERAEAFGDGKTKRFFKVEFEVGT